MVPFNSTTTLLTSILPFRQNKGNHEENGFKTVKNPEWGRRRSMPSNLRICFAPELSCFYPPDCSTPWSLVSRAVITVQLLGEAPIGTSHRQSFSFLCCIPDWQSLAFMPTQPFIFHIPDISFSQHSSSPKRETEKKNFYDSTEMETKFEVTGPDGGKHL